MIFDCALHLQAGDAQHAATATSCRRSQPVKIKRLTDPFDILESCEFIDEFGSFTAAKRSSIRGHDDGNGRPVSGGPQNMDRFAIDIGLSKHDKTARGTLH